MNEPKILIQQASASAWQEHSFEDRIVIDIYPYRTGRGHPMRRQGQPLCGVCSSMYDTYWQGIPREVLAIDRLPQHSFTVYDGCCMGGEDKWTYFKFVVRRDESRAFAEWWGSTIKTALTHPDKIVPGANNTIRPGRDNFLYQSELQSLDPGLKNRYTIELPHLQVPDGETDDSLIEVLPSDRAKVKIVERFGLYLKREEGYDFPLSMEARGKGYLFNNDAFLAITIVQPVGAAVFAKHKDDWLLAWVWIHPYFRRKGILTAAWPEFKREFGEFSLQYPLSEAMEAFVRKMAPAARSMNGSTD